MTSPPEEPTGHASFAGLELDHLGIAVPDLQEALGFWRDQLGAIVSEIEEVPEQRARVAFLSTGAAKTELIEPTDDDSAIGRFLSGGRKGIHHVAYRVRDIDAHLERLHGCGVELIHREPVSGSRGTRVAFVHPRASNGVLVELVEYPAD